MSWVHLIFSSQFQNKSKVKNSYFDFQQNILPSYYVVLINNILNVSNQPVFKSTAYTYRVGIGCILYFYLTF